MAIVDIRIEPPSFDQKGARRFLAITPPDQFSWKQFEQRFGLESLPVDNRNGFPLENPQQVEKNKAQLDQF